MLRLIPVADFGKKVACWLATVYFTVEADAEAGVRDVHRPKSNRFSEI